MCSLDIDKVGEMSNRCKYTEWSKSAFKLGCYWNFQEEKINTKHIGTSPSIAIVITFEYVVIVSINVGVFYGLFFVFKLYVMMVLMLCFSFSYITVFQMSEEAYILGKTLNEDIKI